MDINYKIYCTVSAAAIQISKTTLLIKLSLEQLTRSKTLWLGQSVIKDFFKYF